MALEEIASTGDTLALAKTNAVIREARKIVDKADLAALVDLGAVVSQKAGASALAATNAALASTVSEIAFARGSQETLAERFDLQDLLISALYLGAEERPGDARSLFTSSLSGSAKTVPPVAFGAVATGANGAVLRVEGAASPLIIASRQDFAIEPGQVYAARWAANRFKNTSDPYGDAVEFRIAWLDANKNYIATILVDKRALTIADGRFVAETTYSRDQEAAYTTPASACYARPSTRILPNDGVTDVEVVRRWESNGLPGSQGVAGREPQYFLDEEREEIRWRQADGTLGPILDIGSARKKAEAARDIAAGYASDAVSQGYVPIYSTVTGFFGVVSMSIMPGINAFRTNGFASHDDGGGWFAVEVANTGTLEPWHIQTNSGTRRWKLLTDVVKLEMFGGKADFNFTTRVDTDNYEPMEKALRYVAIPTCSTSMGGPRIQLGYGFHYKSQETNLKTTCQILGYSCGQQGGFSTRIVVPENTKAFIVNTYQTFGEGLETTPTRGADASLFMGLCIRSLGGADITKHAIVGRARFKAVDVFIESFPGNGYHIVATAETTSPTRKGNANNCEVTGGRVIDCLNGAKLDCADANICVFFHVDFSSNRGWRLDDGTFLGIDAFACHFKGNGKGGQVSDGTNRYYLKGTTEQGATIRPGSDDTVWGLSGPSGPGTTLFPLWVAGNTYYPGGPFQATSNNAQSTFSACYVEGRQPPANVMFPSRIDGGINISNRGNGATLRSATWKNLREVNSELLSADRLGVADYEGSRVWNQTAGSGRWARMGFYVGYLADGVTPRGVGRISGRTVGALPNSPVEFGLDVWDGTTNAFVRALVIASGAKSIGPADDNVWSVGTALARPTQYYAVTGAINTSDERTKQQIEDFPDEWLDPWGGCALVPLQVQ